mgnify:CR=1 FL=1
MREDEIGVFVPTSLCLRKTTPRIPQGSLDCSSTSFHLFFHYKYENCELNLNSSETTDISMAFIQYLKINLCSVVLLLLLFHQVSYGVDLQPNDIIAPIPNKNYISLSYQNSQSTSFYKSGSIISNGPYSNPVINTNATIARISRTYEVQNLPAVSYLQLPYSSITTSGSLSAFAGDAGIGDMALATAIWPYYDHQTRTYFGVAGYLIAPTGSYSNQNVFNVGENRYKYDLQMGFHKGIMRNLDGSIAIDTMWYGGNSQCAASCGSITNQSLLQKPLTTVQTSLIYTINPIFTVAATYFYVWGGETLINNQFQNNEINTQRYLLSGQANMPFGRLSLQYGRDMEVTNGLIQSRVLFFRYLREF